MLGFEELERDTKAHEKADAVEQHNSTVGESKKSIEIRYMHANRRPIKQCQKAVLVLV